MINYILIYTHTHTHGDPSMCTEAIEKACSLTPMQSMERASCTLIYAVQTTPTNSSPRARRHILVNLMIETKFVAHTTPHREGNSAVVMLPDGMGWALARSIIYPSLL